MIQRVIIIGAGIGGLCTAVALQQAGMEVRVYERAPAFGRVGAGLTLWSNAIQALGQLGLDQAVVAAGIPLEQGTIRSAGGRILARTPTGRLSQRLGAPTIGIHRADLHQVLLQALAEDVVTTGVEFIHFTQDNDTVTAHFNDGSSAWGDLLIGADGLYSAVRRQLFPGVRPCYAGYTAWRGVAALAEEQFPGGRAFESWGRGRRFGGLRVTPELVYWFATKNAPAGQPDRPDGRQAELLDLFQGWHEPIEALLRATPEEEILRNDIDDLKSLARWSRGRVTLLGDAAHATTPNMGQGACQAIESAVVLARCLANHDDLAAALQAYEARRRPRTAFITRQSWRIGRVAQWENGLACTLRNTAVRLTPPALLLRQLESVLNFDV
ncbi:MAG: FAD-dependent monooxygenase [Chloroflexi bacterium]|nr:FAD-dependent monooxygenase [Chloroflexota bacterium]MCI0576504.1 FAD-dependent monooxygenase [Chloroflexota bacterium]MCI0650226.1 FAD-dependent monooxygenase [Chloroflexota bacterium]MCI0729404.1 FAD-dependent monooxygenase [Chloroflexota bacterium]